MEESWFAVRMKRVRSGTPKKSPSRFAGGLMLSCDKQLRRAALFNLLRTFFTIPLTGITVRWVLLGRVLLVRDVSTLLGRVLSGLIHSSRGIWLPVSEVLFIFVSHELLLYKLGS